MQETYMSAWGQVLLFLISGLAFVLLALLVSRIIRPHRPNPEKLATYESGEEPQGPAWVQVNNRFYVIALVFLLFETEVVFLFPWAAVFADESLQAETRQAWGWFSLVEMFIFVGVLALGLVYAWVNGHLNWVKPEPKPTEVKSPVPVELYKKINEKYK